MNKYLAMAEQEVAITGDLSQEKSFTPSKLLDEGNYFGYICSYADVGNHSKEYQGKVDPPCPNYHLGVALFEPNEETGEFEFVKIISTFYSLELKTDAKSNYMKIFNALATKDFRPKHMSQYFGQVRNFYVEQKVSKKTGKPYNTIDWTRTQAGVNPMKRTQAIELPIIDDSKLCMFLWNTPTVEMFNKLTDRVKEQVLNAHNLNGSAVDLMIQQAGNSIEMPKQRDEKEEGEVERPGEPDEKPKTERVVPKVTRPTMAQAPAMPDEFDEDVPFEV